MQIGVLFGRYTVTSCSLSKESDENIFDAVRKYGSNWMEPSELGSDESYEGQGELLLRKIEQDIINACFEKECQLNGISYLTYPDAMNDALNLDDVSNGTGWAVGVWPVGWRSASVYLSFAVRHLMSLMNEAAEITAKLNNSSGEMVPEPDSPSSHYSQSTADTEFEQEGEKGTGQGFSTQSPSNTGDFWSDLARFPQQTALAVSNLHVKQGGIYGFHAEEILDLAEKLDEANGVNLNKYKNVKKDELNALHPQLFQVSAQAFEVGWAICATLLFGAGANTTIVDSMGSNGRGVLLEYIVKLFGSDFISPSQKTNSNITPVSEYMFALHQSALKFGNG